MTQLLRATCQRPHEREENIKKVDFTRVHYNWSYIMFVMFFHVFAYVIHKLFYFVENCLKKVKDNRFGENQMVKLEFGMNVSEVCTTIDARVLPPPMLYRFCC